MKAEQTDPPEERRNSVEFDRMAARVREGMQQMGEALVEEFKEANDGALTIETLPAMVSGVLCQAVEFYFNTNLLVGISMPVARAELDKMVDDYWKQSVAGYFTRQARENIRKDKAPK